MGTTERRALHAWVMMGFASSVLFGQAGLGNVLVLQNQPWVCVLSLFNPPLSCPRLAQELQ